MSINRLHHVQITIPLDRQVEARAFYCDVLGMVEIEKPDSLKQRGGFWIELGDVQIHIGVEDGVDRLITKAHIAYQVDDIGKWKIKLIQNNIEIKESIPIEGFNRFEFRDPFGNRVEFIQPIEST